MVFILFMTLTSYSTIDLPKMMAQSAGRSSWIPIIIASALFGIVAIIIVKLNNMFLGKVFFDYGREVIGKFFTYVIAVYYILYYLILSVYLKSKMVDVISANFLPKTPKFILIVLGMALFAMVAYKGITNIARMFEIFGISLLIITLTICIIMVAEGDKYNVLPLLNPSEIKKYTKTIKDLFFPFGGLEVLLIIPFTAANKKAPATAFFSLLFIGFFYVLIVESTIMILGINNTILLKDSFIEAFKIAQAPVIERLDIFYLTFGLTSLFSGMIIVTSVVTEYACRIFSKVKRIYIVSGVFIVFAILGLTTMNMKDIEKTVESYVPYLVSVATVLIPVLVFILAKIKKRSKLSPVKREE